MRKILLGVLVGILILMVFSSVALAESEGKEVGFLSKPNLKVRFGGNPEIENPDVKLQAPGAGAAALIPYRSPAVQFSRNILVSRDKGRTPIQCGPHLAVHPKDPNHIVVVLMDYNFPGISSYVSVDGGATWEGPVQPKISRNSFTGVGDPVVAFDRNGTVFSAQMSLDVKWFWIAGVTGRVQIFNIESMRSEDGGFSWKDTVTAAPGRVLVQTTFTPQREFPRGEILVILNDKPWIAIGPHPEHPDQDVIYITYTRFMEKYRLVWIGELPALNLVEESSCIEIVRSEDGGLTWSRPVQVSPHVRHMGKETRRLVQGSQVAVAPDGTVYVAWIDSTEDDIWEGKAEIWFAASKDGGRTFSQPRLVDSFLENPFASRTASFRFWGTGFPQMAVGPEGEIYIVHTCPPGDNPQDDGDVFLLRSFDGGESWEKPLKINDDKSDRLQFFASVAVDPQGTVHAIWGDMRDDPTQLSYHIYYSFSKDKGKTWEFNSRVSDFPSNPNYGFPHGRYIGDYFTIKATKDDVYIAWADCRLGQVTGINQKIGFARKKLMPSPSIFVSPPSGSAGRDIVVQGHHFQPESEIFLEIGGVVMATGRTAEDGSFSLRLFMPISGEGERSIVAKDISGNVAIASFYTEFGFGNLKETKEVIEELEKTIQELKLKEKKEGFDWTWYCIWFVPVGMMIGAAIMVITFILLRKKKVF